MAAYPSINDNIEDNNYINNTVTELGKAPFFDVETGQHIIDPDTASPVLCTDADTIRQWIYKTIYTSPDVYDIYSDSGYGIDTKSYIGRRDVPDGFSASMLKVALTEQLTAHPYIKAVENYVAEKERFGLKISFTARLIDGSGIDVNDYTINKISR